MFKKMSVALLGGACTLVAGATSASAFDNTVPNDPPAVLYQPQVAPAPVRVASNANMGGGFIEFLFGDGPGRGPAYAPPPVYQQQPGYNDPRRLPPMGEPQMQGGYQQGAGLQQGRSTRGSASSIRDSRNNLLTIPARKVSAPWWSIRRTSSSISSRATAGRCATALASAVPASPGPA